MKTFDKQVLILSLVESTYNEFSESDEFDLLCQNASEDESSKSNNSDYELKEIEKIE